MRIALMSQTFCHGVKKSKSMSPRKTNPETPYALMIHGWGANTSHGRQIGVVMRFLSPHVKKTNNALDYGVPMRGPYDTGNYTLCDAPRGLFHPADRLRYEEI